MRDLSLRRPARYRWVTAEQETVCACDKKQHTKPHTATRKTNQGQLGDHAKTRYPPPHKSRRGSMGADGLTVGGIAHQTNVHRMFGLFRCCAGPVKPDPSQRTDVRVRHLSCPRCRRSVSFPQNGVGTSRFFKFLATSIIIGCLVLKWHREMHCFRRERCFAVFSAPAFALLALYPLDFASLLTPWWLSWPFMSDGRGTQESRVGYQFPPKLNLSSTAALDEPTTDVFTLCQPARCAQQVAHRP